MLIKSKCFRCVAVLCGVLFLSVTDLDAQERWYDPFLSSDDQYETDFELGAGQSRQIIIAAEKKRYVGLWIDYSGFTDEQVLEFEEFFPVTMQQIDKEEHVLQSVADYAFYCSPVDGKITVLVRNDTQEKLKVVIYSSEYIEPLEASEDREGFMAFIRSHVPDFDPVPVDGPGKELFGIYSDAGPARLSGEDLYLFPDDTYYYLMWADILPSTIYDKGQWEYRNGYIILTSDNSVPQKDFPKDVKYIPYRHEEDGQTAVFLFGAEWTYAYFQHDLNSEDAMTKEMITSLSPEFYLTGASLKKDDQGTLTAANYEETKKRLMDEAWRPDFFDAGK